jgi:hypothetical protein
MSVAVLRVRRLVAVLSQRRFVLDTEPAHAVFVADKSSLGHFHFIILF